MQDLIAITSAFLTATGLFFAALGATATYNEPLKVLLSASALLMSVIWLLAAPQMVELPDGFTTPQFLLAVLLPVLFLLGWTLSLVVHGYRWVKGMEGPTGDHQ